MKNKNFSSQKIAVFLCAVGFYLMATHGIDFMDNSQTKGDYLGIGLGAIHLLVGVYFFYRSKNKAG